MSSKLRKTIFRIFAGISAFLLLNLLIFIGASVFYRPKQATPDTTDWQTGMVFFSVGDAWESAAVRSITGILNMTVSDSTPSHCGVVIRNERGPLLVHASTSAGHIVAESPEEYIENNGSYCLYVRPQSFQLDTIKLKSDTDSLLRIPVPFDFDFDHLDAKSLYCTEFVITLFELNGNDDLSSLREKHFIYPQDILNILDKKE